MKLCQIKSNLVSSETPSSTLYTSEILERPQSRLHW